MGYSMRDRRYRYTEWRDWSSGRVTARELYDHERDAEETVNVADEREHAAAIPRLAAQLAQRFPPRPLP